MERQLVHFHPIVESNSQEDSPPYSLLDGLQAARTQLVHQEIRNVHQVQFNTPMTSLPSFTGLGQRGATAPNRSQALTDTDAAS